MKNRFLAAVSLILQSLVFSPCIATETVTIAGDVWCPYNCSDGGYMIEIAREIFKKNDIDIDYRVMPWKDAVDKTRAGDNDAVVGTTHDDAPDFIYPESLQGMSDMRFWVPEDSQWSYNGIESLGSVRLAVVQDYAYSKELNAYIKAHASDPKLIYQASGSTVLQDNLEKLKSRQVDVLAEDYNVINYFITAQSAEYPIKPAGTPMKHEDLSANYLYIAFSPKNPKAKEYAAMLDAGMKELRDSGELGKILEIYRVNDWYGISKK